MERNLALLPRFSMVSGWLAWQPVLALYIQERFGIDGVLDLAAIMYLGVVAAEVPSGWMSDRLGRVVTLRCAAALWVVAHLVLLFAGGSFAMIAFGEVLLASGFAAISGTDVSFHYDTLEALDREHEYEEQQSRLRSFNFVAVAASSLVGGALGLIDLRLAFVASLVASVWQLAIAARFSEPPRAVETLVANFVAQLRACSQYLRKPLLRWILGYWIAMVVLEHVAHTLAQPYLAKAMDQTPDELGSTPLVVGVVFALFSLGGAAAAAATPSARQRLGFFGVLIAVAILSASIVSVMAVVIALPVALLLVFRSVQGASAPIVLTAAVAPVVAQYQRATYLSLHSLAGRIVYAALLFGVSATVGDDLRVSLVVLAVVSWTLVVLLAAWWTGGRVQQSAYD